MKGFKRILVIGLATVVIGIGAATALFPMIASSSWGNTLVESAINRSIPGTIHIKSFSIGWLGSQKIAQFTLDDPNGNQVISLGSLEVDTPLFILMTQGIQGTSAKVEGLNFYIHNTGSGLTNLDESLGAKVSMIDLSSADSIALNDVSLDIALGSSNGVIKAEGITSQNNISGSFHVNGQWDGARMNWDVDVKGFPVQLLDTWASTQYPEIAGLIHDFLGESVSIQANEVSHEGETKWHISTRSEKLNLLFEAKIDQETISLTSPAKATLRVTQESLKRLSVYFSELEDWKLSKNSEINLHIQKMKIPVQFFSPMYAYAKKSQFYMQVALNIPEAEFVSIYSPHEKIGMNDFALKIESEDQSQGLRIVVNGNYIKDQVPLKYRLETRMNSPSHVSKITQSLLQPDELEFSFDRISTAVMDSLIGLENQIFENAFGKHVSLRLKASGEDSRSMKMSVISDKLDIPEIRINVDQDLLLSNQISKLSGKIKIEKMIFKSSRNNSAIHSISIPWKLRDNLQSLELSFKGKTAIPSFEEGKITGELKVSSLHAINEGVVSLLVNGSNVPSAFLEVALGRREIEPLFGRSLDFDASLELDRLNGAINAQLSGTNGHTSLDARMRNGVLTLRQPLKLEIKGTNELGTVALSRFASVFNELIASDQLMTVEISPERFSIPLFPFKVENMTMERATITMGKLHFNNAGDVKRLLTLLRAPPAKQVSVWTTPIYLSLQNGELQVHRTDMLVAERYPIASWGKINLASEKVNMVIGLTGEALANALNMPDFDKTVMIQVPIKGTISNAKIDSSKITTKIASLVAKQQGGAKGLILGTVLNLANGKDGKVPAPTTSPLPWKTTPESEQAEKDVSYSNQIKEIQKEASKAIEKLFH